MIKFMNNPMGIENKSFEIIKEEMIELGIEFTNRKEDMVVRRTIHTTADFEYGNLIRFNKNPIQKGMELIKEGSKIYVDTSMIKAGINKRRLKQLKCELINYVSDDDVIKEANEKSVTRSTISIEKAIKESIKIFVIGNAPTALFTLINAIREGSCKPELIIGVPIGFVGAAESKEELEKIDVPYILIKGRKGGSTVAVSIINAIMYLIDNERF